MTVEEFQEQQATLACNSCKTVGTLSMRPKPPHHIELYCRVCGKYQMYLKQNNQPNKRPKLDRGTSSETWEAWGNCCAHCGLHKDTLEILGVGLTVQHVPPFKENGHQNLIPYCDWCQQRSASEMKRLTSMVERLVKKFDISGDK
jgi:hypothetical protein